MKRLFLFDLDGTLVNTGGAGLRALSLAFEDLYGIRDAMRNISPSGKTDPAIFREMIRVHLRRDAQPGEIERLGAAYLDHLSRHAALPGAKGALEGVHEILEHLRPRADAVLALGTGNLERGARIKLAPYRLNEFFPIGGFGSDSEDRPELLRIGHRRAESAAGERIPAERVYVIGDTILDVSAARAAGYRAVAVASGGSTYEQLVAVKPDHTMRSLREAFDWLKALEAAA